jgi:hypothetical protein
MTLRRWLLVGAAILAAGWVLGAESAGIHAGVQENHLLDALVGGTFIGAGLVAIDDVADTHRGHRCLLQRKVHIVSHCETPFRRPSRR